MAWELWKKLNRFYGILQAKYLLDGFEGLDELSFKELSREVLLFQDDDLMGVSLGANQTMLNKKLTHQKNKSAREFIQLHEEGHARDNSISSLMAGIGQTILTPLGVGVLFLGLFISILEGSLISLSLQLSEPQKVITNIGVFLSILVISSIFSYNGELKADLFVIENIGTKEFIETDEKLQNLANRGLIERVFWRLSHPPAALTTRIYNRIRE